MLSLWAVVSRCPHVDGHASDPISVLACECSAFQGRSGWVYVCTWLTSWQWVLKMAPTASLTRSGGLTHCNLRMLNHVNLLMIWYSPVLVDSISPGASLPNSLKFGCCDLVVRLWLAFQFIHLSSVRVSWGLGAYPSCHWASGRVHPGQVSSL